MLLSMPCNMYDAKKEKKQKTRWLIKLYAAILLAHWLKGEHDVIGLKEADTEIATSNAVVDHTTQN